MLRSRSINTNSDIENPLLWGNRDFFHSSSDIIGRWSFPEVFQSTAVTIDLESKLLEKTIEDSQNSVSVVDLQLMEVKKIRRLAERLNALEEVSGLINDLSPEKKETFENAIKRRTLF